MTLITDVLHDLVRRGLALRIETNGTLFIYDPQRLAQDVEAVLGPHLPAVTSAPTQSHTEGPGPHDGAGGASALPPARDTSRTPVRRAAPGRAAARRRTVTASTAGGATRPGATASTATASTVGGTLIVLPDHDGTFVPTSARWRGITWHDVPGHDEPIKKLNFALLKRGMLHGHKSCARLHGEVLRQRLQRISERNRDNSQIREDDARLRNTQHVKKNPLSLPP